ncbi:MAG TPA: NAD(P)/FAD-dependent oxidoreductase [Gammaproteobacteria bacterium]|nr:NAD(P)/FAD-dependent oxidoreductase [Gammaproteobacteria bacterium]
MSEAVDTVVIGAGAVGLAIGRALALEGREVIVLEKNQAIGTETSSRSSEVIHAGIYYTPGSLKAHLCVQGRDDLYAYCRAKGIAHARCGKLIVAVSEAQEHKLEALRKTAQANGVAELHRIGRRELEALEPAVVGTAALLSPSTGIVDSHGLMLAMLGDLERSGGALALRAELLSARYAPNGIRLSVGTEGATTELTAKTLINAAGLGAAQIASAIEAAPASRIPAMRYAKGSYFIHQGASPFRHLVYPLPEDGGLGVHATLDLAGRTRFGPDVEWIETIDYTVEARRGAEFYAAVRRYWPALAEGALQPGYAGIRPKLAGPGEPSADFMIQALGKPGQARIIHLFGIESPGLTASLAIGEHVRRLAAAHPSA